MAQRSIDGQSVFVKQYHGGDWGRPPEVMQAQAAAEVDVVRRISSQLEVSPRLGRMRIVQSDPHDASLTTEKVPGESVQAALLQSRPTTRRGSCTRAILLAGRWLRMFQDIPTDGFSPVQAETEPFEMVDYCDIRLRTLLDLHVAWPKAADRDLILDWLRQRMRETPDSLKQPRWCHGDFGPTNLFWDGQILTPIDFATCSLNYSLIDATYFIHRLEMLRLRFPWRRWPITLWRRAILRGYGTPEAQKLPIYSALALRHLLCRLQTLVYYHPCDLKQRFHNAWLCHQVCSKMKHLLAKH